MTGDLNMGNHKVSSSHVPSSDDDLVNKKHLDAKLAHKLEDDDMIRMMNNFSLKVNKAGDTMSENLNMGPNKISCRWRR